MWRTAGSATLSRRIALAHLFLAGSVLILFPLNWGENGPFAEIGALVAASLSPLVAFAAAVELLAIGAYISPLFGTVVLAVWVNYGTRLHAFAAPVLALVFGGMTTWAALLIEDQIQTRRISNEAAALGATCLNLRTSVSDHILYHWSHFPFRHPHNPSHARAQVDGVDMIWSYGEDTFIVPDSRIRCIDARRQDVHPLHLARKTPG